VVSLPFADALFEMWDHRRTEAFLDCSTHFKTAKAWKAQEEGSIGYATVYPFPFDQQRAVYP
jgi:hypothetical protein